MPGDVCARHLGAAAWVGHEGTEARYLWPHMFARIGDVYEARYGGLRREHLTAIARSEPSSQRARLNPLAQTRAWTLSDASSFDEDDAHNPRVEGRLRRHDCGQVTDGAAAVILCAGADFAAGRARAAVERASRAADPRVGPSRGGARLRREAPPRRGRALPLPAPARRDDRRVPPRAGVADASAVDGIEVHDCFSVTGYVLLDHFGVTAPGEAGAPSKWEDRAPRAPINPSGGLIGGGHPVGATGVRMVLDAARQVTDTAGPTQLDGARTVATLNLGGSATTAVAFVLGQETSIAMKAEVVAGYRRACLRTTITRTAPARGGPSAVEYNADDLDVIEGQIPRDLSGTYLRNTENPLLPAIGRYHPFDGDGMLHAITFEDGRARYRNRMVATEGLAAELAAGATAVGRHHRAAVEASERDGWGARTRMKDASSTDVVVHAGAAISTFYQCGDAYYHDPESLDAARHGAVGARIPRGGSRRTRRSTRSPASCCGSATRRRRPTCASGWSTRTVRHRTRRRSRCRGRGSRTTWPSPSASPIFNDLPLFWDPRCSRRACTGRASTAKCRRASRSCRGAGGRATCDGSRPNRPTSSISSTPTRTATRWCSTASSSATPCRSPTPPTGRGARSRRWSTSAPSARGPTAGASTCAPGKTREEPIGDLLCEFPSVNGRHGGRRYRYAYAMTAKPGWFLFDGMARLDVEGGAVARYRFPEGVYASEAPMCPRRDGARPRSATATW